jgi:PIN domain nuclease of toxin-antitoxin system
MPYVTDTHAIIWHLTGRPYSSTTRAKRIFQRADTNQDLLLSSLSAVLDLLS